MMSIAKHAGALLLSLLCLAAIPASAAYPERPINWVVAFPVGGGADQVSRILSTPLAARLGQPIVVDNRPGAGGIIAEEFVARSNPDGYTLLYDAFAFAVNPSVRKLNYDPEKDLIPVIQMSNMPVVMVVPASAPYKTLPEFIEYARKNPQKLSYGMTVGSAGHLAAEMLFKLLANVDVLSIPYKGGGAMLAALYSEEISATFAVVPSMIGGIRGGKARALAVAGTKRLAVLPDTPTFAEYGYPQVVVGEWGGVFAPKGTPTDIIERLNREIRTVVADPQIVEQFQARIGTEPIAGTPTQFSEFLKNEFQRWGALTRKLNLRVD